MRVFTSLKIRCLTASGKNLTFRLFRAFWGFIQGIPKILAKEGSEHLLSDSYLPFSVLFLKEPSGRGLLIQALCLGHRFTLSLTQRLPMASKGTHREQWINTLPIANPLANSATPSISYIKELVKHYPFPYFLPYMPINRISQLQGLGFYFPPAQASCSSRDLSKG